MIGLPAELVPSQEAGANRWLHVRLASGFTSELFERFRSGCILWKIHVQTDIEQRARLGEEIDIVNLVCMESILSNDRKTASLPLAGTRTIRSRALYENALSCLLRQYMPITVEGQLEVGLTEVVEGGFNTNWLRPESF